MATMIASSAVVAPYGPGRCASLSVSGKSRLGGRVLLLLQRRTRLNTRLKLVRGDRLRKLVAPIAASAAFYLQATASAVEDVVKVEESQYDLVVLLGTAGVYLIIYFFVILALVYNFLRLWYKRNTAETFFQFMLVFIVFPGIYSVDK